MHYFFTTTCLFFLCLVGYSSIEYSNPKNILSVGSDVWVLEDSSNNLSINDVRRLNSFVKTSFETPNFNISRSAFWVKFVLKNNTIADGLLLEVAHPILDRVDFFEVFGSTVRHEYGSEFEVFGSRKYDSPNFIFDLNLSPNEEKTYYLRVKSGEQVLLPLFVGTKKKILETESKHAMIFGIYAGIMLIMFIYNLFVFFTVRDKSYLYYIFYILTVGLTQACIKGYAFKYLWPNIPDVTIQSIYWISALSGISAILFLLNFIKVKEFVPWSVKGFYLILGLYSLSLVFSSVGHYFVSIQITNVCALFGSLYTLFVAILVLKKGYRPAKYFLLGWSVFLASVIAYVLKTFAIVPHNSFTNYILELGSAIETILLSFALADKINTYKKESFDAVREKEKILAEQNVLLEEQVNQRTKKLEATVDKLRSTQSQLVQSEKMASLGQLTAGMAHEINNPLNYMSQGVEVLKEDIKDLKTLLFKYDEVLVEDLEEIKQLKKDLQIDFVYTEIDEALSDIEDGINRTVGITSGLKTFSRLNESDFKLASIHENLDSTLSLMKHELGIKNITVKKDYVSTTDQVECNPGKMNQVFMNLLTNSIHALNSDSAKKDGEITIRTNSVGDQFLISIKDNGMGMSAETRNKLFDPFFTTKDVGEGTGLGMSIVHGIINDHSGTIDVISELNSGTEIKILIPFNKQ